MSQVAQGTTLDSTGYVNTPVIAKARFSHSKLSGISIKKQMKGNS